VRVLFLGTPAFAVPTLLDLLAGSHQVAGVITRPDRRRGRGGRPGPSPVRRAILDQDLPVLQPERVNTRTVYEQVEELGPDVAVVVAFGSLLSTRFLAIPRLGCINLHASLLPRYRGAAPIQWSVARGDAETGLTTMQMDAGMDTGDILLQRTVPIGPEETAAELAERLARLGGPLMLETLDGLEAGTLKARSQPAEGASRAPLLRKEDGRIDWTRGAVEIVNLVRGMQPWPVAHTLLGDIPLRLFRAAVAPAAEGGAAPGIVGGLDGDALVVGCGDGQVAVRELQFPNRRRMTGREAVNGRALRPGDRLV
jgi:methionyl-tRNA formyltransferase